MSSSATGRERTSDLYGRETFRPRDDQADAIQQLVADGRYPNKSEAYRRAIDLLLAVEGHRERGSE